MMGFPGWPGPAFNGRRGQIGGVVPPAFPSGIAQPGGMPGMMPGGAAGMAPGMPPSVGMPGLSPSSPFAGLAARGVPIGEGPGGQPVLRAGANGTQGMMPPMISGMPQMPPPPTGMFSGVPGGMPVNPLSLQPSIGTPWG